jgi:hypothetical protein
VGESSNDDSERLGFKNIAACIYDHASLLKFGCAESRHWLGYFNPHWGGCFWPVINDPKSDLKIETH